jgi:hypothetical protein
MGNTILFILQADTKSPLASANAAAMRSLSAEDRSLVTEMQKTFGVKDIAKVVDALRLLRSLDPAIVEALGQLDPAVVRKSMAGNTQAERVGDTVLRQLANFVSRTKKPMLKGSASEVSTSSSTTQSQASAGKRPAANVPSLFDVNTGRQQRQPEKKQRFDAPSLSTDSRAAAARGRPPARPILLPTPRARQAVDSSWRAPSSFNAPLLPSPRLRPAGPRGFGRGPMGF